MKKLLALAVMLFAVKGAMAAEIRPIAEVNIDAFIADTQITPVPADDDHVAFVWWIPHEFWRSIMARDNTSSQVQKKATLEALSGVSILAVVQADISMFGAFSFYAKEDIAGNLTISFTDETGGAHALAPMAKIDPDLDVVLGTMRPILEGAMGNLGANLHFYVFDDTMTSGERLMNPYKKGQIAITVAKKDGNTKSTVIPLPLNALFVPRKCPNGREAHVSWNYCPWSGAKLPD